MTTFFFGGRWAVAALDGAVEVKTPLGTPCLYCSHDIADGERGYLQPAIRLDQSVKLEPVHRGCDFAMTSGHSVGICPCNGFADFWDRNVALEASGLWKQADQIAAAPLN